MRGTSGMDSSEQDVTQAWHELGKLLWERRASERKPQLFAFPQPDLVEKLLPTIDSKVAARHRPWGNPLWGVAFVACFALYVVVCTLLLVQVHVLRDIT